MLRIIIGILLVALGGDCAAQGLASFKTRLALPDSSTHARVRVTEQGSAAQAVNSLRSSQGEDRIKGYRVVIFFDNSQSARDKAAGAAGQFRDLFPDVHTYMIYEIPYFKVSVGDCVTMDEAIILKGRIAGTFPSAFVSKEDILISKLAD